jgi:hypothetical protein
MQLEIISLIYKSPKYLRHIVSEMQNAISDLPLSEQALIGIRVVANDPTEEVVAELTEGVVPYSIYKDRSPDDYYLNRVYRAWNYAGQTSKARLVLFVNSDMVFHEGWLRGLLDCYNIFAGRVIPCSLLVESGNLRPSWPAIEYDFGKTLESLDIKKFTEFARKINPRILYRGGLFMPCILHQSLFDPSHLDYLPFPEGNIYEGGIGAYGTQFLESGDAWYFRKLNERYGLTHITTSDSITYHIQEGERNC